MFEVTHGFVVNKKKQLDGLAWICRISLSFSKNPDHHPEFRSLYWQAGLARVDPSKLNHTQRSKSVNIKYTKED